MGLFRILGAAATLLVLAVAPIIGGEAPAPVQSPQLSAWSVESVSRPQVAADPDRLRVVPAFAAIESTADRRGVMWLPLPSGQTLAVRLDDTQRFDSGYVATGPLTNASGTASLSVVNDTLAARIVVDGQLWIVQRDRLGHEVSHVDESTFAPDGEPIVPSESGASSVGGDAPVAEDASTVDLLVLYTPAVLARYGSADGVTTLVNLAVANSNSSLANSGLTHRFRLVRLSQVSYTEATVVSNGQSIGDAGTDLSRVRNTTDGYMDTIHAERDAYGADVVTLLTQAASPDVCGLGYVMQTNSTSFASSAFNIVVASCAAGNLSFPHEIGHNMGLQHDAANAGFPGVASYAYGYRVPGVARSVMAYDCAPSLCPRTMVFSSPNAVFPGTSTAAGVANSADNTRALNLTFATVAAFRTATSSCSYTVSPTSVTAAATASTATITVTTTSSCPWSADAGVSGITTTASTTQGSGTVQLSIPANTGSARTLSVTIANQTVTVSQAGACTVSMASVPASFAWSGGAGSLVLSVGAGCSGWTVTSNQAWATFPGAASGSSTGSINVAYAVAANSGASAATRSATFTLTSGALTTTATISQAPPTMTLAPDPILFTAIREGVQPISTVTPEQEVLLTWAGATAPVWTASIVAATGCPSCPATSWVRLTGTSGTGAATLRVAVVDTGNVLSGQTSALATLRVSAPGYATTDVTVRVTLASSSVLSAPFGYLDSPTEGATGVSGSIAVGGWALDDAGVDRVDIYRGAVPFDPPAAVQNGLVYVGRALFVTGNRPDVAAAYGTTAPRAQSGGWGLLMLTNALPHQGTQASTGGQGTFTIVAIAVDIEGRSSELGRRTITVNNDTATLPFGAIDTPAQGGSVPDTAAPYNNVSAYPVFGWALSPGGVCIATDGSTIDVVVDGVVVGHPTYNLTRADISANYAGYCNSTGAVGVYYLNASALSDGLHTIAWRVRDASGRSAEIGSRYFRVARGTVSDAQIR